MHTKQNYSYSATGEANELSKLQSINLFHTYLTPSSFNKYKQPPL